MLENRVFGQAEGGGNEHRIIFVYNKYSDYCYNNSYLIRNS